MAVRGIRGAITVAADTTAEILSATKELLTEVLKANNLASEDIASIFFTTTPDLVATFPAEAARELGLVHVPLLCASEIAVPGRLPLCVRVLLHVNTDIPQVEIAHIYLREARKLRPDVCAAQ